MFVVTGATGNTGSVVANALLDRGQPVRVLARNADKARPLAERGAEVVVGDFHEPASLERVFRGARAVYLVSPPDDASTNFVAERRKLLESVVGILRKAAPEHVVLLSSIGAQHEQGTGPVRTLHDAEQLLRAAALPSTFIRAAYFVENWGAVLPVAKQDGVLPSFIPAELAVPMVSTEDIGRAAARALLEGPRGRERRLELSGPADVSPSQVAAAVGAILGRTIRVVEPPLDAVVPTFTAFGVSADVAGLFREMYGAIANGKLTWQAGEAEAIRGSSNLHETLRKLLG